MIGAEMIFYSAITSCSIRSQTLLSRVLFSHFSRVRQDLPIVIIEIFHVHRGDTWELFYRCVHVEVASVLSCHTELTRVDLSCIRGFFDQTVHTIFYHSLSMAIVTAALEFLL